MKFRVILNKWIFVIADSKEEAMEKAIDGDTVYEEEEFIDVDEVSEFTIEL